MPSGREYHNPKPYQPPSLDASAVAMMRAPLDPAELGFKSAEADSDSEDEESSEPVGAFPGTEHEYRSSTTYY
jgi:hypothetical protein